MLIMIVFWMKLSAVKKLSLEKMRVLIVKRNSIDDNNHNAIFNVVFHYIMIKYKYVNIIWIFISFSLFNLLLDSVMFIIFKMNWCPTVSTIAFFLSPKTLLNFSTDDMMDFP